MSTDSAPSGAPTHQPPTDDRVLAVPGARLAWSVRGDLATCTPERPPLVLFGSPMDSTGFAALADHLPERVVVRYDPRNTGRSERDDPAAPVTTAVHARDLGLLLEELGGGPVDLFGSSGGAFNALTLVGDRPDLVRVLVAHEPPVASLLPDADVVAAVGEAVVDAYDRSGEGAGMARFIAFVMHRGPFTPAYLDAPAPDPAQFGLPTEDDGSRGNPLMENLRAGGTGTLLDLDALRSVRAGGTRVVLGVGADSGGADDGELPSRAAFAVARALGTEPVTFPGGHGGFVGEGFGVPGQPAAFAARLEQVLDGEVGA